MMMVDAAIIHVFYGVSLRGDPWLVAASACLLLIGYLSFGALLVLLTQSLAGAQIRRRVRALTDAPKSNTTPPFQGADTGRRWRPS
jgi:hypothetical protein